MSMGLGIYTEKYVYKSAEKWNPQEADKWWPRAENNKCQEVAVGYKFCVSEGLDTLGDFMPEKKNTPYSNNKQSVHNGMPAR